MSFSLADGIAQQLKCSICLEEYKNPKLLRCYHSFCQDCVKRLLKGAEAGTNIIKCPQCRTDMEIRNGDVEALKSNFFINNLLEIMEKNRQRRERSATIKSAGHLFFPECKCATEIDGKCETCDLSMCKSCMDAHLRGADTEHHKIIYEKSDISMCEAHTEEMSFFCQKCEQLGCAECVAVLHQDHHYVEVKKVLKTRKKAIDWLLVRCKAKTPALNEEIRRFEVMEEMTQKHADDTQGAIDDQFSKLIAALEYKRDELKDEVKTLKLEKLKQICFEKENVTMSVQGLLSGIEFTEQATKEGNLREFLTMRNQILSRLEELSEIKLQKSSFDGKWNFYLHTPYETNVPLHSIPFVSNFRVQSDNVEVTLNMTGGEPGVMYTTFMNQPREFVITLKDHNGLKITIGGQEVRVAARIPPREPHTNNDKNVTSIYENPVIQDNQDGTHCFTYKPKHQGVYYLSVIVNGKPLSGDVAWTVEGTLGFGDSAQKLGVIQMYSPFGTASAWHRVLGEKHSWKIKRLFFDDYTIVRVGVMMDFTSNKWGWCNGRREEPEDIVSLSEYSLSRIPSWQEGEVLTFYNNEETGRFIIYSDTHDKSEEFSRCPGTVARPYIYPTSYKMFSMNSGKLERKLIRMQSLKS